MLKALRVKAIRLLWMGQALSSIGDEIYRVGLVWIAVGLIGADAGYLNCAQLAALMIMSFVGGKWADHWEPLPTMRRVDAWRFFIVLVPVAYSFFAPISLGLLTTVAILLSGLGAFFDPALQAVLPAFAPTGEVLQSATGLMMTTIRFARMVGPGLVGILATLIPPIHFFTMDAVSFLVSFLTLKALSHAPRESEIRKPRMSIVEAILSGFRILKTDPEMNFILWTKAITGGTWNLAFGLGYALLVQEIAAHDTRAFGLTIASYGLGNFAGALYFGNRPRVRPAFLMFVGYIWLGTGFILNAFCYSIPWLMVSAAYTAFSGTANEVTFFDMVQNRFSRSDITKIARFRVANDTLITLVLMLAAPMMIRLLGVRVVIAFCGVIWVLVGTVGMFHRVREFRILGAGLRSGK